MQKASAEVEVARGADTLTPRVSRSAPRLSARQQFAARVMDAVRAARAQADELIDHNPKYVGYNGPNSVSTIVANPAPGKRLSDSVRARHAVAIDKSGRLEWQATGKRIEDVSLRLVLRDDGKLYACPPMFSVGEFALGEDRAIATIGIKVKGGRITAFKEQYSIESGTQYESSQTHQALLFLALEARGVRVQDVSLSFTPMASWDSHDEKVGDVLRSFADRAATRDDGHSPLYATVHQLCVERAARSSSAVNATPDVGPADHGVKAQFAGHQLDERAAWSLFEKIRVETIHGAERAVVPTEAREYVLDTSGAKLRVVQSNGSARPPSAQEAAELARVLGHGVAAWSSNAKLTSALLAKLERTTGPIFRPPVVQADQGRPFGLTHSRSSDESLCQLLPPQRANQTALDYATAHLMLGYSGLSSSDYGLGALSPDGKHQSVIMAESYAEASKARLVELAGATGRTMHTVILGIPVYAKPGEGVGSVNARLASYDESRGWHRVDSQADRRKAEAKWRAETPFSTDGKPLLEALKSTWSSSLGDLPQASMARLSDPASIKELMLHLRTQLPPDALRNIVLRAVAHDQVPRGSEQAWLDVLRRALVGTTTSQPG